MIPLGEKTSKCCNMAFISFSCFKWIPLKHPKCLGLEGLLKREATWGLIYKGMHGPVFLDMYKYKQNMLKIEPVFLYKFLRSLYSQKHCISHSFTYWSHMPKKESLLHTIFVGYFWSVSFYLTHAKKIRLQTGKCKEFTIKYY